MAIYVGVRFRRCLRSRRRSVRERRRDTCFTAAADRGGREAPGSVVKISDRQGSDQPWGSRVGDQAHASYAKVRVMSEQADLLLLLIGLAPSNWRDGSTATIGHERVVLFRDISLESPSKEKRPLRARVCVRCFSFVPPFSRER